MTKIGLVGCGGWGKNLARNLNEMGVLTHIVDPSPAAKIIAESMNVTVSNSLGEMFGNLDLDGVVISTPAETHFEVAMAAIKAGLHVYVEKPIALTTADAFRLSEFAESAGRILMVGHLLQYHPIYVTLRSLAENGRFGRLRHMISTRMNLGVLRNEENVMWSFSPHDISMVLGLAQSEAKKVRATGSTFLQADISDIVTVQIQFEHSATAEIRSSWVHPEKEQKLVLVGEHAMAVFDDRADWSNKLVITDYLVDRSMPRAVAARLQDEVISVAQGEPLRLEMQHFVDCIAGDQRPRTDAKEAIAVLSILQAAQISLDQQGIWIDV